MDNDEIIWRWGHDRETPDHLNLKSQEAQQVINIHGVTTFAGTPPPQLVVSYAQVADLVGAGFPVHITPLDSDPNHRTVELPQPVTEDIARRWNHLWNRGNSD